MKNTELQKIANALNELGTIESGENPTKLKIGWEARLLIARNLRKAREAMTDLEAVREGLIRQHGTDGTLTPGTPGFLAYAGEFAALLDQDSDVEFDPIPIGELQENPIPISILEGLLPIIE